MVVIISLFFCLLTVSLFGGSVYVLVDKIKLVKRQNQELEAYRAKVAAADEIINAKSQIIANANQIAESTILKAKKESDERSALCERLDSIIAETQMQNANLRRLKSSLEEDIELCNLNFYKPHYDFEKALDYERALFANRNEHKAMIQAKKAVIVERGAAPDKKLAALLIRLLLRTFNSECDLMIQNVDFKNVVIYENRINNSFEQLNKLTLKYCVMITSKYRDLKLEELRIYHEFQEKKQLEAEEQRQIREIMREEIRAERELEKAKAEAEKEEQKYQSLLDKAMEAARQAQGVELERMNAQIAVLQQQLKEAKEKERAISQAQLTKSGHVYVISNIGSFGENVFKIGMTRRPNPQDRIDELGDASVPFQFDVHAMIHHENAPELEHKLHQHFEKFRMNKINPRKEFFKVSLDEIERVARQYKGDVTVTRIAEAKEYRQTLAMEKEMQRSA